MPEWMKSLWDTPDGLVKVFYWTQWAIAIFGILTAAAVVLSVVVSRKRDGLIALSQTQSDQRRDDQISAAQNAAREAREAQAKSAKELAKLKVVQEPRKLTPDQKESLLKILKAYGSQQIELACLMNDLESCAYAKQIEVVLEEASWRVNARMVMYREPFDGLLIVFADPNQIPATANMLSDALKRANIPFEGAFDRKMAADTVELRIGKKH